jgi:hypothetical protein
MKKTPTIMLMLNARVLYIRSIIHFIQIPVAALHPGKRCILQIFASAAYFTVHFIVHRISGARSLKLTQAQVAKRFLMLQGKFILLATSHSHHVEPGTFNNPSPYLPAK